MSTPLEVTLQYFNALDAGDMDTVSSLLDDDCTWHQPGRNRFSGQHVGPAAIGELITSMMHISQGTFRVTGAGAPMVNGHLVAVPVRFRGERDGAVMNMGGIDLMTVKKGKIVRVDLFSDDSSAEDAFWGV